MAGACAAAPAPAGPVFDPGHFFAGETQGRGELKVVLSRTRRLAVEGHGVRAPDGGFTLDQWIATARLPSEPLVPRAVQQRQWVMRPVRPGRWEGTLTGARPPVVATAEGSVLQIAYTQVDGYQVRQRLTLAPDGQSALNQMSVWRLGVPVARLTETITRQ